MLARTDSSWNDSAMDVYTKNNKCCNNSRVTFHLRPTRESEHDCLMIPYHENKANCYSMVTTRGTYLVAELVLAGGFLSSQCNSPYNRNATRTKPKKRRIHTETNWYHSTLQCFTLQNTKVRSRKSRVIISFFDSRAGVFQSARFLLSLYDHALSSSRPSTNVLRQCSI